MKSSVLLLWASIVTAVLSVCAVIAVIKLLVVPQLGSRSAVALCTISHVHTSHNCVFVTVGYMTTDGTQARGYILPYSQRDASRASKCFCENCSHMNPENNSTQIVSMDQRRFQVGQTALCLKHEDAEALTLHKHSASGRLKCAILLPSVMFIVAFVSCFISAICICKDMQLEEEKARRMARQSTLTRLSRRL